MSAPQRKPNDRSKFRKEWLANLALQASNNQLNQNASNMFKQTGASSLVRDMTTPTEKTAKAEGDKHLARDYLAGNKFMNSYQAGEAVASLLRPDDLRFLLEYQDFIATDYKPRLAPPEVFVNYLHRLRDKAKRTQGVEFGLQETSGYKLLTGLSAEPTARLGAMRQELLEAPLEAGQKAKLTRLLDDWTRLVLSEPEEADVLRLDPEGQESVLESSSRIVGELPAEDEWAEAVGTGDFDSAVEMATPSRETFEARRDIDSLFSDLGRAGFASMNTQDVEIGAEQRGLRFAEKEEKDPSLGSDPGRVAELSSELDQSSEEERARRKKLPPFSQTIKNQPHFEENLLEFSPEEQLQRRLEGETSPELFDPGSYEEYLARLREEEEAGRRDYRGRRELAESIPQGEQGQFNLRSGAQSSQYGAESNRQPFQERDTPLPEKPQQRLSPEELAYLREIGVEPRARPPSPVSEYEEVRRGRAPPRKYEQQPPPRIRGLPAEYNPEEFDEPLKPQAETEQERLRREYEEGIAQYNRLGVTRPPREQPSTPSLYRGRAGSEEGAEAPVESEDLGFIDPNEFRKLPLPDKIDFLRARPKLARFANQVNGTNYNPDTIVSLGDRDLQGWYRSATERYEGRIPRTGSGLKGTGLGKKKKSAVERSTGYVKPQPYTQLGSYLINKNKLKDGVLMVKYPSGQRIAKLPSQAITKELVAVLNVLIEGKQPTIRQFQVLSEAEKDKLHQIVRTTGLGVDVPNPKEEEMDKDLNRFEILKGEIIAGNDNEKILKEFKAMLIKFGREGRIPRREVNSILEELLHMGH